MNQDVITKMLEQVAAGEVSVDDARTALEGIELSEETYESAIDHGVFNRVEPGAVVRAAITPSGTSALVILISFWGLGWTLFWAGSMTYGLFNGWDQQQLSYHFAMTMVTLMIMGIVYLKWVLPDLVVVKHRRNKFIGPKDPESWKKYEV
uniref:Uncharacterized protein n=3 Tax=environmental samples TaxID=68359 RepID=A0A075HRE0_9EURY|nr:hypothetical protein [uncultured marine group II/III euryarchaeote KM3_60_H01]AIF16483.1 hypothetical protein [uncultured marine group II/III euryarchaeote KM3_74_D01]AIF19065.1 hypothetical protein [uncultured marine group II/III euryarchaeote KM3_85_D04]MBC8518746.1 hypothetical protein [Euryarchaeota archaeon]